MAVTVVAVGAGLAYDKSRSADAAAASVSTYTPVNPQYEYLPVSVIGDSYANGSGASMPGKAWPNVLASSLCWKLTKDSQPGTGYVDAGAPADGGSPYTERLTKATENDPALIIVQGSTNDTAEPGVFEAASTVYRELRTRAPQARLVAIGPTYAPSIDPNEVRAVRDALRDAAARSGVEFVDPLIDPWLPDDSLYSADRLHPTDAGHAEFASDVRVSIEPLGIERFYACDAVPQPS